MLDIFPFVYKTTALKSSSVAPDVLSRTCTVERRGRYNTIKKFRLFLFIANTNSPARFK